MMFGAAARQRIEKLEQALTALHQQIASEADRKADADRARADDVDAQLTRQRGESDDLRSQLAGEQRRLDGIEAQLREILDTLADHVDRLHALAGAATDAAEVAEQLAAHQSEITGLEAVLMRLARRVDIDAAEAAKTATALLERIDRGAQPRHFDVAFPER